MIKWFKNLINDIKLARLDVKNKKDFINDFNYEMEDPTSFFAVQGMKLEPKNADRISMIVVLDETFAQYNDDILVMQRLNDIANAVNRYLTNPFGWAEYFYAPEIYKIDDPDLKRDETSLTYLLTWKWAPKVINTKSFRNRLIIAGISSLIILGGIITGLACLL
jgi:hypothetical protein